MRAQQGVVWEKVKRKRDHSLFSVKVKKSSPKVCRPTVGILLADRIPTVNRQLTDSKH